MVNENNNQDSEQAKTESPIAKLFIRVVQDEEFKKLLIEKPDEALKDYELSEAQVVMIKNLDKEDLDKLNADNLEEYFSADAAVYTPDETDVLDEDAYTPEDFEDLDDEYEADEEEDI